MSDSDMGMNTGRSNMKRLTNGAVIYIPAMMDGSCGTMPMHHRQSPVQIMMREMRIMAQNTMICLPDMVRSMWATHTSGRNMMMSMGGMDMVEACTQAMLGVMELCYMMFLVPACMMLPGFFMVPACLACAAMIYMLCWPMNGDQVVRCPCPTLGSEATADERWVCINGSMTR